MSVLSFAQTNLPKYSELEERYNITQNFKNNELENIGQEIQKKKIEIENYQSSKFLKYDLAIKAKLAEELKNLETRYNEQASTINIYNARNTLNSLKKYVDEKALFDTAKSANEKLEKDRNNSNRLNKFYQALKESKYTKAKIQYALLNPFEKLKADEFEKNNTYILQNQGNQQFLKDEIKKYKIKAIDELSKPEAAIVELKTITQEANNSYAKFQNFKKGLENNLQFDYKLPSVWDIGLFSCEEKNKPKYFRLKNYPNLVILSNEGSTNSVIKLDPDHKTSLNIAYKCKKMGSFGACLDNKEKSLCQLDSECGQALSEAEGAYNQKQFFNLYQVPFATTLLNDKKKEMTAPTAVNLISEFAKQGRLGFYKSAGELFSFFDQFSEKIKSFPSSSPDDFFKKVKTEISNMEKAEKKRLASLPGFSESSEKGKQTLQLLSYALLSVQSSLEEVIDNDVLQRYAYKSCSENNSNHPDFCEKYKDYQAKADLFGPKEEIVNFVPEECPRVVFRFESINPSVEMNLKNCNSISPQNSFDGLDELDINLSR